MHLVIPRERRKAYKRLAFALMAASCLAAAALLSAGPAAALSEVGREELPPIAPPGEDTPPAAADPEELNGGQGEQNAIARPEIDENGPLPEIVYNLDRLPEPVRRMHDLIVEAAKSGEIEKLRPLIGLGDDMTQLSFGDIEGDPIAFLKGLSGDSEGQEILAIMEEVLNAGFVHLEAGTPNEIYVWPYFFGIPLDKLDPRQKVELFKIVTAGDLEDMKQFGTYIFYRVGITPEGHWAFFVAGE
jgi:hypothetical protein